MDRGDGTHSGSDISGGSQVMLHEPDNQIDQKPLLVRSNGDEGDQQQQMQQQQQQNDNQLHTLEPVDNQQGQQQTSMTPVDGSSSLPSLPSSFVQAPSNLMYPSTYAGNPA